MITSSIGTVDRPANRESWNSRVQSWLNKLTLSEEFIIFAMYHLYDTGTPSKDTISKHSTSNSCPMRSIRAEWIGRAYISGSLSLDHRKLVSSRAMNRDAATAQQKKRREKATKVNGIRSHPSARRMLRKMTSTGRVTIMRVIITKRGLASRVPGRGLDPLAKAAACSEVESRETKIEPTAPGRPLITTARRAKPS
jgi:hypothetical protein